MIHFACLNRGLRSITAFNTTIFMLTFKMLSHTPVYAPSYIRCFSTHLSDEKKSKHLFNFLFHSF